MEEDLKIDLVRDIINEWGTNNLRDYPWRKTNNPYIILITEVMLHRTRADKVAEIFQNFFLTYPNISTLSEAVSSQVLDIIKPLGLGSRSNKFIKIAECILNEFGGYVPSNRDELLKLPGVGQYISGMVIMCAFGKHSWAIDTNISRVFKRVMGLFINSEYLIDKELKIYTKLYFDSFNPRYTAYALLDFGALVCKYPLPSCSICPIAKYALCCYFETFVRNKPVSKVKIKKSIRF